MPRSPLFPLILGWTLLAAGALHPQPRLLLDVDPRPGPEEGSGPKLDVGGFLSLGSRALFWAVPPGASFDAPQSLWASDGTLAGTTSLGSFVIPYDPVSGRRFLGRIGRVGLFFAITGYGTPEQRWALWRSDGTAPGTFPLALSRPRFDAEDGSMTVAGGRGYLSLCTAEDGCEPWTTDGSRAGTRRLRDLTPGGYGSNPRQMTLFAGQVYFFAQDPEGVGLWRTDGSTRGTVRVAGFPPGFTPQGLRPAGDRLYFLEWSGARTLVWTSDGTAEGTRRLSPFAPGPHGPSARWLLAALGDLLLFSVDDPRSGGQLWRSDGSDSGTYPLAAAPQKEQGFSALGILGDRALFADAQGRLWSTRGTRGSTAPLFACRPRCPVAVDRVDQGATLSPFAGRLAFAGRDAAGGIEPWITDGTAAGTRRLADSCPGPCDGYAYFPSESRGSPFFYAGQGLWASDGTPAGTARVPLGGGYPMQGFAAFCRIASGFLFATYGDRGVELWRSDGTAAGSAPFERLSDGASSSPSAFTPFGSGVLFSACHDGGTALWSSDGTTAGTRSFLEHQYCFAPNGGFQKVGDRAYFLFADPETQNDQLWRTDGTPQGTRTLSSFPADDPRLVWSFAPFRGGLFFLRAGDYGDHPQLWRYDPASDSAAVFYSSEEGRIRVAAVSGDRILFTQEGGDSASSLWISDGTAAGTVRLQDFGYPWDGPLVLDPVSFAGATYFRLVDFYRSEIWRTDGTAAGTRVAMPIADAPVQVERPQRPLVLRGALLFFGLRPTGQDYELALVRTDGRAASAVVLKRFPLGDLDPEHSLQTAILGDTLYFVAPDPEHGLELWRSDGTAAGTTLVRDLAAGPAGARIEGLTVAAGRLFFAADDGIAGQELWVSDGTADGTSRVADLAPGEASSSPAAMTAAGGLLYFSADDGERGREPWVLKLSDLAAGAIRVHR
jgi:ELWxxDGT repeat protein